MNRIEDMVRRMEAQIQQRLADGIVDAPSVEATGLALDMDMEEYVRFQELKSLAVANGKLSLEEGQYIYGLLGNDPAHFNRQDIAVKAVLTEVFKVLLGALLLKSGAIPAPPPAHAPRKPKGRRKPTGPAVPGVLHLTPAYGRDYKSKAEVVADWEADKDFQLDGRLINKAQVVELGVTTVNIRYQRLRYVAVIQVIAADDGTRPNPPGWDHV